MKRHVYILGSLVLAVTLAGCSGAESAEREEPAQSSLVSGTTQGTERGRVDASKVLESLEPTEGRLTACLQSASKRGEDPWGGLIVAFELAENGELRRIEFIENDAGEAAARCIERHLRKTDLPAPSGGPASLRRFYAFSSDGDFDTEVSPPEEPSETASSEPSAAPIVLEPTWMIPFEKESVDSRAENDESGREKHPSVSFDAPLEIAGPGEHHRAALESTLGLLAGDLQQCYLDALESRPDAEGEVVATFTLHEDGSMTDVTASSDAFDDDLERCFAKAIESAVLPPPDGGHVEVTKPFGLTRK